MEIFLWPELHEKISLSRTTIWRLERQGKFPKRRILSPNRVGWLRHEVEEFLENLKTGMAPPPAEALKKRAATSHADRQDEHRVSGDVASPEAG